jgi:HD-like signal output (HDOD) protein
MIKTDAILNSIKDFPTLPTIYTKLVSLISNPRSTVQDIADVILQDQATTIKLLRVVNSPIYGIQGKVTNVSKAIFFIGFNEVKNIVLSLSIMDLFNKVDDKGSNFLVGLWKHSVAVGVITRILGSKLGINNTEDYFVSGIIHDIGTLFYLHSYRNVYSEMIQKHIDTGENMEDIERQTFGMTRHVIGELIADKWKLPANLKNVIRYHHIGSIEGKTDALVSCIHLSNIISILFNYYYLPDSLIPTPNFQIWTNLNFEKNVLQSLFPVITDSISNSFSILKLAK